MAAKKKPDAVPPKDQVAYDTNDIEEEVMSKFLINPVTQAAFTLRACENRHSLAGLHKALAEQVNEVEVNGGNMSRPEAMLLCQAHTLDALFNSLANKAYKQTYIPNLETFLRLALKAQGQCRATLETLANIKNPPVVFAKQANINNNGNQQINNDISGTQTSHAGKNKNQQNELLTELPNETLDTA